MRFLCAALVVLILAVALRAWRLDIRPMHGDEAVHAYKFGQLLEENYYRYDPHEFHGPTLNYFTLIPARLSGKHTYTSVTESTLRVVPVFFGVLLVIMPLLLAGGLGRPAALIASAITAISPAFVFYSRYYIQEMLLACFTFAVISAGYKYAKSRKVIWALLAGAFVGLCHATKETCLIAFGSMLLALLLTLLVRYRNLPGDVSAPGKIRAAHLVAAAVLALCVSGLFFSSFLTNLPGVLDSFGAYATYLNRAGRSQLHIQSWYYYLQTLLYSKSATGPPWTEASVVILAAVGVILIVARKGLGKLDCRLLDFLALYTGFMLAVYSAIPYKTPWCLLSFYHGMILLAAVGIVAILNLLGRVLTRVIVAVILLTVATDLSLQAFLASTVCYADLSNPYVYSQPTDDVLKIATRIEQVSDAHPARREMPVFVVCPDGDYWPLPWYLRSFKNVGWYNDVNEIGSPAPVVIDSPGFESRLITRLYDLSPPGRKNLYVPLFDAYVELRPGVEMRGYVTKDLRDQYQQQSAGR
jgi:uncharacterized protein (TIGR03663 family)